jgi:hypothetical protein
MRIFSHAFQVEMICKFKCSSWKLETSRKKRLKMAIVPLVTITIDGAPAIAACRDSQSLYSEAVDDAPFSFAWTARHDGGPLPPPPAAGHYALALSALAEAKAAMDAHFAAVAEREREAAAVAAASAAATAAAEETASCAARKRLKPAPGAEGGGGGGEGGGAS